MDFSDSTGAGGGSRRPGQGRPGFTGLDGVGAGLFEAFDGLRDAFGLSGPGFPMGATRPGPRRGRGDVRIAILALLAERPMHGYQIINEISERSGGAWKPSPGSVYPTLQLLADEGLVHVEEAGDRKTYSLTDTGREAAADAGDGTPPWEEPARHSDRLSVLPKASVKLAQAVAQVSRTGTPEQVERAVEAIDEARRRMYAILAED